VLFHILVARDVFEHGISDIIPGLDKIESLEIPLNPKELKTAVHASLRIFVQEMRPPL
jgi:hypothetical protein